ncbi:MAG: DUF4132 domain-containing protein, partial [Myxococcales bacterium]|nr:DUF4132 domain-containing protein [Myxococcales bacterium]
RFVSPRAALAFAQLADRKAYRRRGLDWLDAHPEMAALGLVPYAIGVGSDVRLARDALRHLVRVGHEAAIRAAARTYGPEAVAAIDALLAIDPLVLDKKPPKPPPFLRPDDLPVLELKAGGALPTDARDALLELLSLLEPGAAYPGLDAIRDALTPESLEAFVMGLLSQWVLGDAPGRHDWMLHACVTLPSAAATRRLGEHTRAWARASQAKASRACGALAAIGDELALLHLGHVAETTRFSKLKREARDLLDAVAARRGLTRDELEDRTVPDLGLDPDGALRLGYGAADRAFVVRLDETLAVRVTDASGAALRSLPRARDTDDEARVKEAKARYDALKKDVAAIADRQTRRLERAMVLARAWDLDFAKDRIFQHPLVRHVARGLVWIDGNGVAFRPTDDGAFADASDEAVTPSGPVRIAHPLELAERETWAALFTDYELLQPFEQLGRATREPTANERALTALDPGVELSPRKLLGLMESRGWRRSDPGWITAYLRGGTTADGDRIELRAELSPGIEIAYLRHASDVRVTRVTAERGGDVIPLGVLSAITFSELVRDLDALK